MKFKKFSYKKGDKIIDEILVEKIEKRLFALNILIDRKTQSTLRATLLQNLYSDGWSEEVRIHPSRGLTITSMLGKTGLCLQTGNMARFYADLLKLQSLYLDQKITGALYILPCKSLAEKMGSNMVNYERLKLELEKVFRKIITIPMLIFGLYEMDA